jgi:hypothetical protein
MLVVFVFSTTFCTRCLHPPNCTDHFSVLQILSVLRTALTIELSLGCVLLYYILKCICALKGKGKNHNKKTRKLKKTASHQNVSTFLSETFTSSPGSAYPFFFILSIYKLSENLFCPCSSAMWKDEHLIVRWCWIFVCTCYRALLRWKQIQFTEEVRSVCRHVSCSEFCAVHSSISRV